VYGSRSEHVGLLGFVGFLLAIVGTAIIAGPDGRIGSVGMYSAGSLSIGLGLVCLAIASWRTHALPRWVAVLWILSTVAGIVGAIAGVESLFTLAGIAFGATFMGAGAAVLRGTPAGDSGCSKGR